MTALSASVVDITTLDVDAIVNAANTDLKPGGGVCGAIHRAAGPELAQACADLRGCPTGDARITPGFRLPARYVIHAVGPVWRGGDAGEAERLASAYAQSIRLASGLRLKSIAFPAISTGVYGFPIEEATPIAVAAVRRAVRGTSLEKVVFACFSDDVLESYKTAGVPITEPNEPDDSDWPPRD
jgi:O-acetyl-ADP-ribose deacetylase (regulator of RNase III)